MDRKRGQIRGKLVRLGRLRYALGKYEVTCPSPSKLAYPSVDNSPDQTDDSTSSRCAAHTGWSPRVSRRPARPLRPGDARARIAGCRSDMLLSGSPHFIDAGVAQMDLYSVDRLGWAQCSSAAPATIRPGVVPESTPAGSHVPPSDLTLAQIYSTFA
jgi:hypothetical protein